MAFSTGNESGGPMAEINVTPLVDVMLVLLIIFMITAPLMSHKVKVELPQATLQKLELDKQITTYVARHSFVTKLISEGATLMEVKSMTGHKSIITTEGYVGSIEDERLKKITSRLLNF